MTSLMMCSKLHTCLGEEGRRVWNEAREVWGVQAHLSKIFGWQFNRPECQEKCRQGGPVCEVQREERTVQNCPRNHSCHTLPKNLTAFCRVLETWENTNLKVMNEFALQGTLKSGQQSACECHGYSYCSSWSAVNTCNNEADTEGKRTIWQEETERENVPFDKERRKFEVSGNMAAE